MEINHTVTIKKDTDFKGLTLLSEKEYKESHNNISTTIDWWWLSSPGSIPYYAAYVYSDGSIGHGYVGYGGGCVRPVLILNTAMSVGDKFSFYNHTWTVISDNYALCDEAFCKMAFRKNWKKKNARVYEASDVKKYLDEEWEEMKNEN